MSSVSSNNDPIASTPVSSPLALVFHTADVSYVNMYIIESVQFPILQADI